MIIPTTLFGIAAVVALVVPGLVYAAIRTTLQGFVQADQSVTARIVQAVMISVLLDSVFVLGVLAPAFIAYLRYSQAASVSKMSYTIAPAVGRILGWAVPHTGYRSVPTAWDWIAAKKAYKWVRVLNAHGRWVGGWTTDDTFFSSYPEPRDLYIPEQWDMDKKGKFLQRSERTSGVWLSLEGAQVVEWLEAQPAAEGGGADDRVED